MSAFTSLCRPLALAGAAFLLAGCNTLSRVPDVDLVQRGAIEYPRADAQAAAIPTGGLYASSRFRPGFENPRARLVGDSITIQISERLNAAQRSSSNVDRESELGFGVSALPFLGADALADISANANSSNTFSGSGDTAAVNTFSGSITAIVTEVLPNGHLVVVGEKQIGVNQNVDVLQFSGKVDPRTIAPGNQVQSTQVADVRVLSRGRGAQNDAQTFGWLSRFFLTLLPF